jgi:ADP-ribosyl-[dinitrogen reductase] hydrolase
MVWCELVNDTARPRRDAVPAQVDRYRGALLGLAAGDAVGTALEFQPPGSFEPIADMVGGGPFDLEPGQWTDDTSMALCLAASLVHCRGFDARDQMNRYCNWSSCGYMSSHGRCFDIGNTVSEALRRYELTDDPFAGSTDPQSAGNGSLMRLAPVVLFYHPDTEAIVKYAGESSRTTHGAQEAIDACKIFAQILASALDGNAKSEVLSAATESSSSERLNAIASGEYHQRSAGQIRGTGYVVDCLEAALWCFARADNFSDAILAAANLGDDADTTAAVCGQIAGAYYGLSGIPETWIDRLVHREEILSLADGLL